MRIVLCSLIFASNAAALTVERTGKMFEVGKTQDLPLFVHHEVIKTDLDGCKNLAATIKDQAGKIVMTEAARYCGLHMKSHRIEQLQISERYDFKIADSKAVMESTKVNADGSTELIDRRSTSEDQAFILGPVSIPYLQKNLDDLINDKVVRVDFGIYEIMKRIEFKFQKNQIDENYVAIQMRPSSFFFNLFVDPMDMKFDRKTKFLVWFKGRTAVKLNVNGKLKPFDSEIFYETKLNAKP